MSESIKICIEVIRVRQSDSVYSLCSDNVRGVTGEEIWDELWRTIYYHLREELMGMTECITDSDEWIL